MQPSPPPPQPPKPPIALAACPVPADFAVYREEKGSVYSLLAHHGDVDTVSGSHGGEGHPAAHEGRGSLWGKRTRGVGQLPGRWGWKGL